VLTSVTLTPTTAYESSTLTCTAAATDADGDAVTFTYAWYVNASAVAATSSTLTGTYFARGDSVYCRATPNDGTTSGTASSSNTVTIANSTPAMSSVSLTPSTAYEATTLTCSASGSDGDGDTLSYAYTWYVNGSSVAASGSTLTGTYFGRGDSVYCSVTPSDGTATGSALASSTVTIANTTPVLSAVSLTPASPSASDTLTCTPTATDADGDTISYAYTWYVDGTSAGVTSSTLSSSHFSSGDTVYCRVTPSDSGGSGTAMSSSSVTIANTAPVLTSSRRSTTPGTTRSTVRTRPSAGTTSSRRR
jgi:hypothetical protein